MLVYDPAVWDFSKGDPVRFRPGNDLYNWGERTGVVTAVALRLVHIKSDQSGKTWHVAPRLLDHPAEETPDAR